MIMTTVRLICKESWIYHARARGPRLTALSFPLFLQKTINMRKVRLSFLFALLPVLVFSQTYQGKLDYDKKKQEAVVIDYAYPQEAVENAIIQKIEGMGNQAKEEKGLFNRDKGMIVFRNAIVKEISDKSQDYIIKIERKSRKEKDETTVYLVVLKEGQNSIAAEPSVLNNAKTFLSDLHPHIQTAHLEIQIKAQEDAVVKAEKKYKDLQTDQEIMEKKIKSLQDDLKDNAKNQEDQQKLIENQKAILQELKGKRK
jgi:hypothetical protein